MGLRRAVLLLLLALPLAACGGTTATDVTSLEPVAQAAAKTSNVPGAHFQMSARIGDQSHTIAFSGPGEIADHGKQLHMQLTLPASVLGAGGTGNAQFELVSSDNTYYLRGGPFEQFAPRKWVTVKSNDPSFNLGQNDPSQMLEYLRATSNVDEVGKDTVRGVDTTHYSARLQLDKVADRVSADAAKALEQATKTLGTKEIPMDVWVDGDGLVRRVKMDWHPKGGSFVMSLDLFDFGDVNVDVPASSDTVDLSNMLGGG
jgi:hypothetical protein